MKFVRLVLRNLLRNRRRTILTALSIAVSLFVFSALIALPAVGDRITAARASSLRLVCHSKAGLFYSLPAAYLARISTSPHVVAASGWMFFGGIYRAGGRRGRPWRGLVEAKLRELETRIAQAKRAKALVQHALACPHGNLLRCGNFRASRLTSARSALVSGLRNPRGAVRLLSAGWGEPLSYFVCGFVVG